MLDLQRRQPRQWRRRAERRGHISLVSGWQGDVAADRRPTRRSPCRSRGSRTARRSPGRCSRASTTSRPARIRVPIRLELDGQRRRRSYPPAASNSATRDPDVGIARGERRAACKGGVVRDSARGVGVRRLPHDAVSRHARSDAALPEGRLRSGAALRARLHREGSARARHRPRGDARHRVVLPPRAPTDPAARRIQWPAPSRTRSRSATRSRETSSGRSSTWGSTRTSSAAIVWDGVFPRIAARQTPINFRFALPGGAATLYEPGSEPVVWWGSYDDHDARAGSRRACSIAARRRRRVPKVIEAFGSAEFWGLRMSPDLIGTDAKARHPAARQRAPLLLSRARRTAADAADFASTPRAVPAGLRAAGQSESAGRHDARADRARSSTWVVNGTPPPPSRYPRARQRRAGAGDEGRRAVSRHSRPATFRTGS